MSERNRLKMICDPYRKEIEYLWYQSDGGYYKELKRENSKLGDEKLVHTTIKNSVGEIMDVIVADYNPGNVGLDIEFIGTNEDYKDLQRVISTLYSELDINCIKEPDYYRSASEVMPNIKKVFETVRETLNEYKEDDIENMVGKYNDVVKPSIPLCVVGLYSAGKSTFINSLIGAEILPTSKVPTTATICKIICSKNYRIKFWFDDTECILTFEGEKYKPNNNGSMDIIEALQEIVKGEEPHDEVHHMNKALTIINQYKNAEVQGGHPNHIIGDEIEIEIPFVQKDLPIDEFEFVIYDTPGTNSASNRQHFEVLRKLLGEQTNALPIYLTTLEKMDEQDNEGLLEAINEVEKVIDKVNAITVINKADDASPDTLEEISSKSYKSIMTDMNSNGIFYVSSVMGLASKKKNPDALNEWIDKDLKRNYKKNKSDFAGEMQLYKYNKVDKGRKDEIPQNQDDVSLTTLLYKNSGLEAIEKEIAAYAKDSTALYNKCELASSFLKDAIKMCAGKVDEVEKNIENKRLEAEKSFTQQQKELCEKLDDKKNEITEYNTEFQKLMSKDLDYYSKKHHIGVENDEEQKILREEFKSKWKGYRENEKKLKVKKADRKDLLKMQNHVENFYNDLLKEFYDFINCDIVDFWKRKSENLKEKCIKIVHGSDALTNDQKKILENVVIHTDNMNVYRMEFDLRKMGAIRNKRFLFWKLSGEKFDAKICVSSIVNEFQDSVAKKINFVESNNGKQFEFWVDKLIKTLKDTLCEFNPKLAMLNQEIDILKAKSKEKRDCENMLKEQQQQIEELLGMQEGEYNE